MTTPLDVARIVEALDALEDQESRADEDICNSPVSSDDVRALIAAVRAAAELRDELFFVDEGGWSCLLCAGLIEHEPDCPIIALDATLFALADGARAGGV